MAKLSLSVAIGEYDRTRALIDGSVSIDGVDPVYMPLVPEEIFFRAFPRRRIRHLRIVALELCDQDGAG